MNQQAGVNPVIQEAVYLNNIAGQNMDIKNAHQVDFPVSLGACRMFSPGFSSSVS